jgi:cytochrome P450
MLFTAEGDGDHREAHFAADMINEHVRLNGLASVRGCPVDLPGFPFHTLLKSAERLEAFLGPWAMKRKGDPRRDDLLSIVVNSPDETGKPASDSMIASQILTLFGAAYETCQTVLFWALFLVYQHPAVAARLLDEISALPDDGSLIADQLNGCEWLDAVLKESMRVLPPVPVQMRSATRDLELDGYDVRNRTRVILSAFLTNRMPGLYPEGDRFMPERWASIDPTQYEYMVYSAGPRFCPGAWFGATLVKVSLVHILKAFRIAITPGARVDRYTSITLAPKRGMPVTLHPQDGRFTAAPISGDILDLVTL